MIAKNIIHSLLSLFIFLFYSLFFSLPPSLSLPSLSSSLSLLSLSISLSRSCRSSNLSCAKGKGEDGRCGKRKCLCMPRKLNDRRSFTLTPLIDECFKRPCVAAKVLQRRLNNDDDRTTENLND